MRQGRAGLTVTEVLVAAVVLTVGLLALAGSWAHTGRMLGWGRQSTVVAQAAASRLAELRRIANAGLPPCSSPEWRDGRDSSHALVQSWQILDPAGPARRIELVVRSRRASGWRADTVSAALLCGP